jgi:hypothetical protein
MQASGNTLIWTGDLHLARRVAVTGGVIRAVAALVVTALELSTVPAFVVGTVGVTLAVGDPRDEGGGQLMAVAAVGRRRRGEGLKSGHAGDRCGKWLSVSVSLVDGIYILMAKVVVLI